MKLGIDPKLDYAFKKLFGSLQNKRLLIALLRAILQQEISDVELLNPFTEKDFIDDKLSILDIKARLADGRLVNIEMQMVVTATYPSRALFYWAKTYHQQLSEGEDYSELRTTISINILNEVVFPTLPKYHSEYRLRERDYPEIEFCGHLQVHVIELPKFEIDVNSISSPLERWCYFLKHGKELEPGELPARLKSSEIERAVEVLEIMTQNDRERLILEAQERAVRDALTNKKVFFQEGREIGLQQGRDVGLKEGKEIGLREGTRQERIDAIEMMLEMKFGAEGTPLMESIRQIQDLSQLREIQQLLRTSISLTELRERLA